MQVGDKVRVYGEETEIIATVFDEDGEEVYMLKGYTRDFYEDEIKPTTFELLESIIDLVAEDLDAKNKNINATLGYEELVQLRDLWSKKVALEVDLEDIDLTIPYMQGREDEKTIWKNKIKEKIEELEVGSDKADGWRSEYLYAKEVLEELLKGE